MPQAALVHQGLPYGSTQEFLSGTLPFVAEGVEKGGPVLVVTGASNVTALRNALGPDRSQAVRWADSQKWYATPARAMAAYHEYFAYRGPVLRGRRAHVVAERPWSGRSKLETQEWALYESSLNEVFAKWPVSIVCPYDKRVLRPEVVADSYRTHPQVIRDSIAQNSDTYADPIELNAEMRSGELGDPGGHRLLYATFCDATDLRNLRRAVLAAAAESGLGDLRGAEVVSAVMEAVANAIRHGGGKGTLELWKTDRELVCDVSDEGGGLDEALRGYQPPPVDAESGRGLWIVRLFSDLAEFRSGPHGSTVRMHMRVEPVS